MKIAMANDHAGTKLKNEIKAYLESEGHEVKDFGTYDEESCDLSDFVYPAALSVAKGECDRGIFAVVCQDPFCAALARQHNDSNVLCLGGKIIGPAIAMEIVKTWMHTDPLTAEKYRRRVKKVQEIDAKHCVAVK